METASIIFFEEKGIKLEMQKNIPGRKKVVWLVSALADDLKSREKIYSNMKKNGIDVRRFFYPLSEMPAYKSFASSSSKYPVSKSISERGISFPTFNNSLRLDSIINRIKKI